MAGVSDVTVQIDPAAVRPVVWLDPSAWIGVRNRSVCRHAHKCATHHYQRRANNATYAIRTKTTTTTTSNRPKMTRIQRKTIENNNNALLPWQWRVDFRAHFSLTLTAKGGPFRALALYKRVKISKKMIEPLRNFLLALEASPSRVPTMAASPIGLPSRTCYNNSAQINGWRPDSDVTDVN